MVAEREGNVAWYMYLVILLRCTCVGQLVLVVRSSAGQLVVLLKITWVGLSMPLSNLRGMETLVLCLTVSHVRELV